MGKFRDFAEEGGADAIFGPNLLGLSGYKEKLWTGA